MAFYSGMTGTVLVSAFDQVTKLPIQPPVTCTVDFFAPPKLPKQNTGDRTPDYTFSGTYDPNQKLFVCQIDTTDWIGGTWWYRATYEDAPYKAWEFSTLVVSA